jgi:hypothetical protein
VVLGCGPGVAGVLTLFDLTLFDFDPVRL